MKRICSLLLALALVITLAGLGGIHTRAFAEGAYTPGTYTASASGKNGPVTVEVSFSEDAILSVTVVDHQETEGVGDRAINILPGEIVAYQSLGIDAASGATYTSRAILAAVADCVTQAGGDAEALRNTEAEVVYDNVLQDSETDVLVIGGGGAGMSAALSAAENGARVIVVEKMSDLGGSTAISGSSYNAVDPDGIAKVEMTEAAAQQVESYLAVEDQNEGHAMLKAIVQQEWDEYLASGSTAYFDTPAYHALTMMAYGSYEGNAELILNMTSKAYDTWLWSKEVGGAEWKDANNSRGHSPLAGRGVSIIRPFEQACLAMGVEIYTNTRATDLIVEDGAVVGAVVTNANGESVTVRANKGVVLATGGFAGNAEMVMEYNTVWESLSDTLQPYGSRGNTGDGIVMALQAGANLVDMGFITLKNESSTGKDIAHGPNSFSSSIYVNRNGERFLAEDTASEIEVIKVVLTQPGQMYYMISDFAEAESRGYTAESLAEVVAGGYMFAGETIEELADAIGADPAVLAETVAAFNASVEAGEDAFGRHTWANKIETGPFIAVPFTPYLHSTLGGVQINTEAEVLNPDGEVIPGLYAAGEVTGDIQGKERMGGNTVPDAITYGRIAGANAAAN